MKMEVFKTLLRFFRSFRFAVALNISGLAVAFTVFLVIVIHLYFEWGYDKSYPKSNRIFRVETLFPMSLEYAAVSPTPLGEILKKNIPEIEAYFLLKDWGDPVAQINDGKGWGEKFPMDCMVTSPSMIDMLDMEMVEGDGKQALAAPRMLIIPERFARKWFPRQSPIGRQIRIGAAEEYVLTVGAVYKDLPENSVFPNACYTSQPQFANWQQWEGQLFVLSGGKDARQLQKSLNELPIEPLKKIFDGLNKGEQKEKEGKSYLKLVPLPEVYFDDQAIYDTLAKGNKKHTYLMLGVGLLVVVIALINFINFSLALAPVRIRAVNTRKVLGAGVWRLRMYFVTETLLCVGIAYLLAIVLLWVLVVSGGKDWLTVPLNLNANMEMIIVVGVGMLFTGGIIGFYPACYTTSAEPAMVMKGNFIHTSTGIAFRNGLSVFQFAVSVILIACSILMVRQNWFMQEYAVGYNTENIGWVKLDQGFALNGNTITNELRQLPGVIDYTFSDFVPGVELIGGQGIILEGVPVQLDIWHVYPNFLSFFGIPLVRGDSISVYSNKPQFFMNEKALKLCPILEQYQGKTLGEGASVLRNHLFAGVTGDVHYLSLHKPIGALAMIYSPAHPMSVLFFKLAPGNQRAVIQQIRNIFDRLAPESLFEFHFLDDTCQQSYEHEYRLTLLISLLGGLAVFLALVGIYGMIVFQAQYRRKEIAIRKVNGATESDILLLLNKGLLYQGLTGFVLACPVAYYMMIRWLRNFSYRTDICIWMFVLAGGIVLLVLLITIAWQSCKAARTNPVKELVKE